MQYEARVLMEPSYGDWKGGEVTRVNWFSIKSQSFRSHCDHL